MIDAGPVTFAPAVSISDALHDYLLGGAPARYPCAMAADWLASLPWQTSGKCPEPVGQCQIGRQIDARASKLGESQG